ncbi:LysR family transcriptional regulator [Undibacterium sp. RTI2.1]|uniref:LysR family transcriptional regulator n=1 Tax=unclassified Undibacterium TaxID=2630295 RepID=UPI002B231C42|nr:MULTISPECIES: LysR family transcriptional regulator [unclassified Undibacterium]MEB0031392.1 LysR family transcriptional regulator [Undibacterium sp. RTI2.1]MEB0117632.1 LysR family transcriptional regulator [Undibacterium sp. RTI2.2]
MNLTLEALQILDAIDRKGSFAAAASALDKVPSAITYSIRKLEDDLDVLLFDRRGHRAKLTTAGQELLTQGRHLLLAAEELEQRVKRTATGWEAELRIVMDGVIQFEHFLPLIQEFQHQACGTRLRISQETLSGVWETLLAGRADLAIGAAYDGPDTLRMHGEYQTQSMGNIDWVFAVAAKHPLATAPEPLTSTVIQSHRAIAVGDTGRNLPSINAGLLAGQDTLTVPTLQAKLLAQLAGLGCGNLPRKLALPHLQSGALVEKTLQENRLTGNNHIAWRRNDKGKALQWFLQRLADPVVQRMLLGS